MQNGHDRVSGKWTSLIAMGTFIVALHIIGWGTLLGIVAPAGYHVGGPTQVFGVGLGITAYTLGLRHAFDADHIAAIDNTTRKLIADGQRPVSVGFWFSVGHSSVVFGLCALLAFGVRTLAPQVISDKSALQQTTGLIGASVSGVFLLLLGVVNLLVLKQVVGVFRRMRTGNYDETELQRQLDRRGIISRMLGPLTRSVKRPWQLYPIGLLFGLGFDTATEVSLLVLAGGAAAFALPWYAILTLPVLFTAGMCLLDTVDGYLMNFAYGWAFSTPVRKVYYNITITALSVAVALLIGGQEIISVVADKLDITTGPIGWVSRLDLNYVGFIIVAIFITTWTLALTIWHVGRIDDRWTKRLPAPRVLDEGPAE
ncbi:HoxN/HupN/NixA family nickel/cobalt transporter [Leifsonia poae]|uniref:Nickel/cobalt efflux system n=2 Tax=Leifsonia poae TaxID=110933 RepID=A0A9W6H7W3_9MICO|nr:nickel/cobalt efflux system [Leifsonia poae]